MAKDKVVVAEISVGAVTFDEPSYFRDENELGGPIADCMIHNHFMRDNHVYLASLTVPEPYEGATVGAVRLGGATLLWVCEWTVCQLVSPGQHPPVPDPSPPPGWLLLDVRAVPAMTSLGPSGLDGVYRIAGSYVYGKVAPSDNPFDDVAYPYAPWLKDGVFPRLVPSSALKNWLKHPGGGVAIQGATDQTPLQGNGQEDGQGLTAPDKLAPIPFGKG